MLGIGKQRILVDMKTSQPKILFFVTEDWFVCSHWLPLIDGAKNAGFEVAVVTRTSDHAEKISRHGIRVIPLAISRRGFNPFRECVIILRLMGIYRKEQPCIVHHVAMKPILYGSLVSYLTRIPHTVNWVAGMGWMFISTDWRAKILQFLVRKVMRLLLHGTAVIVENKDDQVAISNMGVAAQHLHLIRGAGVDTLLYAPSPEPEGEPMVILVARMLWDKGVGEFVEAASLLKKRGVKARFVLVGESDEGNPASVSNTQLVRWQKDGAVEWWGRREDMPHVLAQSHIVCLPSYREGLPKSLLEAASCGRPIVTTNVPGCRGVVCDGGNGILVEVRNSAALADALAQLLADSTLRQRMGRRGRERVIDEFSQEKIVAQVLALYREIIL
ncbi:MAG: glycosyltransferase family 4 protein [Mariprofundaceae bacterium]